jgi:hypothetical protein
MEGENPTRRYKWFRPRQAASAGGFINGSNSGAVALFNDSVGSHVLVVRSVRVSSGGGTINANSFNLNRALTGSPNPQVPVMSSTPQIYGQVRTEDLATYPALASIQFDQVVNVDAWWEQTFPIAVVEPGWSFGVVNSNAGKIGASFLWEAVTIDELDYIF